MTSAQDIIQSFWSHITPRQREILEGRFGVSASGDQLTLAGLGERYGITRERVRQIEANALKNLRPAIISHPLCAQVFDQSKKYLKNRGGVARAQELLEHINGIVSAINEKHMSLLLAASKAFHTHPENEELHSFYYLDEKSLSSMNAFLKSWQAKMHQEKERVLAGEYKTISHNVIKESTVDKTHAQAYLNVSKNIHTNPYGVTGLAQWPEIKPSTIRDRIYLVLRQNGKPLHFQSIAKLINTTGFGGREALAPTVHNELIKDDRFILVGRGMYALSEHGFSPGTAREVISRIIKRHGPLKPKQIVEAVQKERLIKPNTVLVNLQNKRYFQRLSDGSYHVKEV